MVIIQGKFDRIRKERGETFEQYRGKILQMKRSTNLSAKEFSNIVQIEGITLADAAELYADVCKDDGGNVVLYAPVGARVAKMPLASRKEA